MNPEVAPNATNKAQGKLVAELQKRATDLGFDAFGITHVDARPDLPEKLDRALQENWHGDMSWMAETSDRRGAPKALWPDVKSIIMLGQNYGPDFDPLSLLAEKTIGNISAYARNRDYHDLIKGRLKELAGLLSRRTGAEVKVFVDTAPVMEKPLAEAAGLGWQGKHTVLVSRDVGSWMFLGAIFTTAELSSNTQHREQCGSCTRCLDICPTNAFPSAFQLDARKCLAYLNIELKDQIPREFRAPMGNRVYGCDDCLAVCPWNKFASVTQEAKLQTRDDLRSPSLAFLGALDDASFRKFFSASPVKRLGHARFIRNVLIAIGNSEDRTHLPLVETRLADADPLVRGCAIWAFRRLASMNEVAQKQAALEPHESDPSVSAEWQGELVPPLG